LKETDWIFSDLNICVEKKKKRDRYVKVSGGKTLGQETTVITAEKPSLPVS